MPSGQENESRDIGERIAKLRKDLGLTQEKLAILSGVDRTHIGFIEQGRRKPTLRTLTRLAKPLKTSLSDLLKGL